MIAVGKGPKIEQSETNELNCQKSNEYHNHTEDKKEVSEGIRED